MIIGKQDMMLDMAKCILVIDLLRAMIICKQDMVLDMAKCILVIE